MRVMFLTAAVAIGLIAAFGLPSAGAGTAVSPAAYRKVEVAPPAGARLPPDALVEREDGRRVRLDAITANRPAVLIFADYTCRTLCGPALAFASAALAKSGLAPGVDFGVIVVGLDPKDGADALRDMRRRYAEGGGEAAVARASTFLHADAGTLRTLTEATGFRYSYDADHDQFIHPAAAFVLTRDLRVSRALSELALTPSSFRLALVEAGNGNVGTLADQVRLICYGFDPAAGTYNVAVHRLLAFTGILTIAMLGGGIGVLVLAGPRRRA